MQNFRPPPPPKPAPAAHPSTGPRTAELWEDDNVPEIDEESFDRVTAIPELPSELLAKQLMAETLEDPSSGTFEREEVTQTRTPAPKLELDLSSLDDEDAEEAPADPTLSELSERYAMGDYSGALIVAEGLLETDPGHVEALRFAKNCRENLTNMYSARLGPLDQVVLLGVPGDQLRWLALDHRAGFLLSLVDGVLTIEELLDISGMPRLDALRILFSLLQEGVIRLPTRG